MPLDALEEPEVILLLTVALSSCLQLDVSGVMGRKRDCELGLCPLPGLGIPGLLFNLSDLGFASNRYALPNS